MAASSAPAPLRLAPQASGAKVYGVSVGKSLPEWVSEARQRGGGAAAAGTAAGTARQLRRDAAFRSRVELLQDFEAPTALQRLCLSADGEHLLLAGTYKPRVSCLELAQLGRKWERAMDAEVADLALLSPSGDKFVALRTDRTLAFHVPAGAHATLRVPRIGRCMAVHEASADLLVGAQGSELYRVNLELGRFDEPLRLTGGGSSTSTSSSADDDGVNALDINPVHQLIAAGTQRGAVEFFDPRAGSHAVRHAARLDLAGASCDAPAWARAHPGVDTLGEAPLALGTRNEVSAVRFDLDGLTFAAGTSSGHVLLYDLRASDPFVVKDHNYSLPIRHISFPRTPGIATATGGARRRVLSSDARGFKIWHCDAGPDVTAADLAATAEDDWLLSSGGGGGGDGTGAGGGGVSPAVEAGDTWISIEPGCDVNDVCVVADTGLIFVAGEQSRGLVYFVPELGPAPRWCSFLENLTEELEEGASASAAGGNEHQAYDDFRFVTREEAENLNLLQMASHGDGASSRSLLQPYLHGFYVDARLYSKARAMANPFEFKEYRKAQIKKRMEARAGSRVDAQAVLEESLRRHAGGAGAARQLRSSSVADHASVNAEYAQNAPTVASDPRFAGMFADDEFKLDSEHERYKLTRGARAAKAAAKVAEAQQLEDEGDALSLLPGAAARRAAAASKAAAAASEVLSELMGDDGSSSGKKGSNGYNSDFGDSDDDSDMGLHSDDSDDDDEQHRRRRRRAAKEARAAGDEISSDEEEGIRRRGPRMIEVHDRSRARAPQGTAAVVREGEMSFAARLAAMGRQQSQQSAERAGESESSAPRGAAEMRFTATLDDDDEDEDGRPSRRGRRGGRVGGGGGGRGGGAAGSPAGGANGNDAQRQRRGVQSLNLPRLNTRGGYRPKRG